MTLKKENAESKRVSGNQICGRRMNEENAYRE